MSLLLNLTWQQQAALRCVVAVHGEACEETIGLEGITVPRVVCSNLVTKGLLARGEFSEGEGYTYKLTPLAEAHLLPLLLRSESEGGE